MYSHLLVPVDDSVLSSVNCEKAVQLAKSLGARITFFHASPDIGATRAGARFRVTSPRSFAESTFGDGYSILAAHAVAAEEAGVTYDIQSGAFNEPANAIVDAAHIAGCDLIVMATHGRRGVAGMIHRSQTERVLRQTAIPVLVTRVESNDPVGAMERVLAVLHREHHVMTAVALGMRDMMRRAAASSTDMDLILLESMLDFLANLQAKVHRPKAEELVLDLLCDRSPSCEPLRKNLQSRHAGIDAVMNRARELLEKTMSDLGSPTRKLIESIFELVDAIEDCIAFEETTVLPLAREHLLEGDWLRIAPAFDPQRSIDPDGLRLVRTRQMFTRLTDLNLGIAEHSASHATAGREAAS